ncbi:Wadjet anti-phage system protein JetD domain-containing protein [Kitasatospora sp. NPDC088134]|uniref:Wadjet anti-phage system protein JetD domain-containing protein n=1 Tax=Kitasatospora sp. NPDC088134 TaxID=3364071 RepID=UPI0038114691
MALEMTGRQQADLLDLFGSAAVTPGAINLGKADTALRASRYAIPLRLLLIGTGGPLITNRARARYRAMTRRARSERDHAELLARIAGVPELGREAALLAAQADSGSLRAPEGSVTGTRKWSVYASALRAAAEWYPARARGWTFGERELAVRALGGSKKWTSAAKLAFSRVVETSFADAVHLTDTVLTMKGPAAWRFDHVIADLSAPVPFLGVPGYAVAQTGQLDIEAEGVLLIENQETFAAIGRTTLPETWLCVWTGGFGATALAELMTALPDIPIAAWADLDTRGIMIVADLAARSGRVIHPVAMDLATYQAGYLLDEESDELAKWQVEAAGLIDSAPEALRPLARAIADNGGRRCEQEGLHELVLPELPRLLGQLTGRPTGTVPG